jgi:hypothetical protein
LTKRQTPVAWSNKLGATVKPIRLRKVPSLANTGHACGRGNPKPLPCLASCK